MCHRVSFFLFLFSKKEKMRIFLLIAAAAVFAVAAASALPVESNSSPLELSGGWLLVTKRSNINNNNFEFAKSTANFAHLRHPWGNNDNNAMSSGLSEEEESFWRMGLNGVEIFVAPSFHSLSDLLSRSSPLVMRRVEVGGRLWLATRSYSLLSEEETTKCLAQRAALALDHVDVVAGVEVWEGERGHEADGSGCYDLISLFFEPRKRPITKEQLPQLLKNEIGNLENGQGNPKIVDLVSKVEEDRLKNSVVSLSSIFSRQSFSKGAQEAESWIASQYESLGLSVSTHHFLDGYSKNVIAELKGTQHPDKIVIVSGHYDSRSVNSSDPTLRAPGADDNASGTSSALEIARVITQSGLQFAYTIRFCAWSGEEQGLRGSRVYAAEMAAAGQEIIAVFNGDMLAYNAPNTSITLGMKDLYITPWLLSTVNTLSSLYVPSLTLAYSASCCSDHQSFFESGFPAVGYFESRAGASSYPAYHKETDQIDMVHFPLLRAICQAMLAAVATFAVPLPL